MSRTTPQPDTIYYDGECGLCHRSVRFVLRHDGDPPRFHFAPQQGETFRRLTPGPPGTHGPPDAAGSSPAAGSVVVVTSDGRTLVCSDATIHILRQLGGAWRCMGNLIAIFPRPIRDMGYRLIAGMRRKMFAKPQGLCPMLPEVWRGRFLP